MSLSALKSVSKAAVRCSGIHTFHTIMPVDPAQLLPMRATSSSTAVSALPSKIRPHQGELVEASLFEGPCALVDIGVNLVDKSFDQDRQEVIARACRANVRSMIVTGTSIKTSCMARSLSDASSPYPLYFTAGVHPHHAKTCDETTLGLLKDLVAHPKCVAIGECGLDFNRNFSPPLVQEEWFEKQVVLAKDLGKPLFMHCRDASDTFCEILRRHMPLGVPAVLHCFTGNGAELQQLLDLDVYIGITGWVCDERPERGGAALAALLPLIPADRLMIETDAPYLTPRTITPGKARPGRNEPALLPHVLRVVAKATGRSELEVAQQTTDVACAVFGIQRPVTPAS